MQSGTRIEQGAGRRIPRQGTQFGDTRCNRTALVRRAGGTLAPLIDPDDANDIDARDWLLAHFGGMYFCGTPCWIVAAKIIRALLTRPADLPVVLRFGLRLAQRAGDLRRFFASARAGELSFRTFVVHNFMDAADVAPGWELLEKSVVSENPETRWSRNGCAAACTP